MLYLDLDKMLYDMKYENVDMDTDGTGDTPCTKFKIWLDQARDSQMYLVVSGRLMKDGTWTIRCRKTRRNEGSVPVKNRVPEITAQALDDIVDDWFETNEGAACLQTDDWDTGDQYL